MHSVTSRTDFPFEGARIPVFVARPAAPPKVTVVMLGAIWSVTEHIEDLCREARRRRGSAPSRPACSAAQNIPARDAPPEVLRQTFLDFDDRRCVRDLRAVVRAAHDGQFAGEAGALVPWGFCLGGRFAHMLGAVSEHVSGVVNFYGRQRFARQPNKPFLPIELTGLIEVPYLGHFAEFDEIIPLGDVEELRAALAERGVPHAGARLRGREARLLRSRPVPPTTIRDAAALAWSRTLDFLEGPALEA